MKKLHFLHRYKILVVFSSTALFVELLVLVSCLSLSGCRAGTSSSATQNQNPTPSVSSVSPTFVTAGGGPYTLAVVGSGFIPSSSIAFNGIPHTPSFVSAQKLMLVLGQSDVGVPGNYSLVVTNPPPGGGSSTSTAFAVWNNVSDKNTGLSFGFPVLGSSSYTIAANTSTAGQTFLDVKVQGVSEIALTVYANPGHLTLAQWFSQNIDINGILAANNTFQTETFADGSPALVLVGFIPPQYLDVGTPLDDAYTISSSGQIVSVARSNVGDLFNRGFSQSDISNLEIEVLSTVQF